MKKVLLVLASLFLLSLIFFLVGGEKIGKYDARLQGESFFEGLRIVQKKNGVPNWVLTAKRADISKDGSKANLTDIGVKVQDREMTIYADKGLYDLNTKKISVDGDITAKNDKYSLTTGAVEIDSVAGLMKTSHPVLIEGKKFTLRGSGMEINNNDQKVRILRDVKATFRN